MQQPTSMRLLTILDLLDYIPIAPTGPGFAALMLEIWDGDLTRFYHTANSAEKVARLCGATRLYGNPIGGEPGNTWRFPNGDKVLIATHGGAIRQVKSRT